MPHKSVLWFWGLTTLVLALPFISLVVIWLPLVQYSIFEFLFALGWGVYFAATKKRMPSLDRLTSRAPWILLAILVLLRINMLFVFIFAIAGMGTGVAEGAEIYLKIVASVYWMEQFLFLIPLVVFIKKITGRKNHA